MIFGKEREFCAQTLKHVKITIVAGARPNFMKIAPLTREIKIRPETNIQFRLVHTGQHYNENLSQVFFDELGIPHPDVNLGAGSGTQAEQTARIMVEFEKDLMAHPSDLVIVVGDVNSTMACSIVAKKLNTKVAHIEAGIRSFDLTMPEEINRMVTDALADYFFTTSSYANENLAKAGTDSSRIFFVGNIMIDSLVWASDKLKQPEFFEELRLTTKNYFVATLHRPSNVDDALTLKQIFAAIEMGIGDSKVILPIHPRTAKILEGSDWKSDKIILVEPMSYLEFIFLIKNSLGVITDSGGVQEETTYLGVPCVTLRKNTERPETISTGTNELIGDNYTKLRESIVAIKSNKWKGGNIPELWDGKTAQRIVAILATLQ